MPSVSRAVMRASACTNAVARAASRHRVAASRHRHPGTSSSTSSIVRGFAARGTAPAPAPAPAPSPSRARGVQTSATAAAPAVADAPKPVYLKDYAPPDYRFDAVSLDFYLGEDVTIVTNTMRTSPTFDGAGDARALFLHGDPSVVLKSRRRRRRRAGAGGGRVRPHREGADDRVAADDAVRARDRHGDQAPGQHRARGPVQVLRELLHAVRGGGIPKDHVLPGQTGRHERLHDEDRRGEVQVPGAAIQREPRRVRRPRRRETLHRVGGPVPEAGIPLRARRRRPRRRGGLVHDDAAAATWR